MLARKCEPLAPVQRSFWAIDPRDGTTSTLQRNGQCASGGAVQLYTVDGGGHTWPQGRVTPTLLGRTGQDFSATWAIWDFVKDYQLP